MFKYPLWCTKCDALTGHEIHFKKSVCIKCGIERPTPILKWTLGSVILFEVMIIMVLFIYSTSMSIVATM
jgi:hypothetical protein